MQNAAEHKRKRIPVCMLACTLAVTGKILQTKFSVLAFYRRVNNYLNQFNLDYCSTSLSRSTFPTRIWPYT